MRWTSYLSEKPNLREALQELREKIPPPSRAFPTDLMLVFVGGYPLAEIQDLGAYFQSNFQPRCLIGCTAGGVIGEAHEVERSPGLSVTLASLPEVELSGFHLESDYLPDVYAPAEKWEACLKLSAEANPHFILLPDPYSFEIDRFVQGLDQSFPVSKKIGGLSSGGAFRGGNLLYWGERSYNSGLVGVALSGNCEIDTIVAQGCHPIGSPMFVTRCQQNLLQELDGKKPAQVLEKLFLSLGPSDQKLFGTSLFLGLVMKESQKEYRQGDFLIRNILGMAQGSESLVIGSSLHVNQVVQFHLRDATTSTEDLHHMLIRYKTENLGTPKAEGGLLFSCLGRGRHLFGEADHDSKMFLSFLGEIPLSGFFCNGEIGPVHGRTFLHGYTSSFGIFRPRR